MIDKSLVFFILFVYFLKLDHLFPFIYLIYYFMAVLGLRFCARAFLVAASGGHSSSRCAGLSLSWPLLWRSTGSQVGATLHRGAQASHYRGLSCCGAQAPDAQAQWL